MKFQSRIVVSLGLMLVSVAVVSFAQDVTHIDGGYRPRARVNVLDEGLSLAGFQVIMYGRIWVITEGLGD